MKRRLLLLQLAAATIAAAASAAVAAVAPTAASAADTSAAPTEGAVDPAPAAGVGMNGTLTDVLLPGPALRVKPDPDGRRPVVVRLTAVRPHGTAGHRYNLQWFAYEPGPHNLSESLEPADGSTPVALPPVMVTAESILPPGPPQPLPDFQAPLPSLGGYRTTLLVGGTLWLAGLIALARSLRKRPAPAPAPATPAEPPLADRLHSLLDQARHGTLDADGRARLERLVLGFWRDRLNLHELPAPEAVRRLRDHPEAGSLLREVEEWLHSGHSRTRESDMAALLAPYVTPATAGTPLP